MADQVGGMDIAERLLALCRDKAEQAEVYVFESELLPVSFESNKPKSSERRHVQGIALRLMKDGKLGAATAMGPADPQAVVERAIAVASFGPEANFEFAGPSPELSDDGLYSPDTAAFPVNEMVSMGRGIVEAVLESRPEALIDVDVKRQVERVAVFTSRGASTGYRRSSLRVSAHLNRIADTDMLDVYEEESSVFPEVNTEVLVQRLLERVRWADRIVPSPSGETPVLFTPKGAANLFIGPLQHAFSGKAVLEGSSPLAGRLGETVFDPVVGLRDVGVVYGVPGGRLVDDEGIPTEEMCLVEQGRVTGFYYDLYTASKADVRSTGNGTRVSPGLVQPGPNLWMFAEGNDDFAALLKRYPRGLVVDQVMGAWAANVMAGEFSGNVHLGYVFEAGEVVGRVKDTMIAGNVFRCLSGSVVMGSEGRWIGGSVLIPPILVGAVSVATNSR